MPTSRPPASRIFKRLSSTSTSPDLPSFSHFTSPSKSTASRWLSRPSRIPKWAVITIFTLLIATLLLAHIHPKWSSLPPSTITAVQFQNLNISTHEPDLGGNRRLRIFMPADSPHINLCKVIMSAVALGYPLPTLLNWGGEFNRPEWHLAGSHIAKLESLLAVIEDLLAEADKRGDAHENDIALLVDAYDIWFQLPPSVLIQRFHQLNREADDRVRRQWQAAQAYSIDFPIPPPRQSIIVTSAKHCSPLSDSGSDPHYAHWPESPLPPDMYGEGTDEVIPYSLDPARRYRKIRPRCVNSGMIMGTMGSLRLALRRSKEKIDRAARTGRQLWSDQALFGEVIGDQEMWREWMRGLAGTWNGTAVEDSLSGLNSDVVSIAKDAMRGINFEFGIGLDYNFTTIPPTCSAEQDGYFVHLDDKAALEEESLTAGVPDGVRVSGVPHELRGQVGDESDPLVNVKWGGIPLFTDFYFGVTPVGIHHNAYVDNLKPTRLREWWDKTWFYPQLRSLVTHNLLSLEQDASVRPLAKIAALVHGGKDLIYLPPKSGRVKKMVTVFEPGSESTKAKYTPIDWEGVCQSGKKRWYDELFGDGKGPLMV